MENKRNLMVNESRVRYIKSGEKRTRAKGNSKDSVVKVKTVCKEND